MKNVVIDLEAPNEPMLFSGTTIRNICINTFFWDFQANSSPCVDSPRQWELFNCPQHLNIDYLTSNENVVDVKSNVKFYSFFLDNSKSKEGVSARCILKDPKGNKIIIYHRLEF